MLTTTLDRFSDDFLQTRLSGLNAFVNRLSRHPLLSTCPDLIAFLSLLNEEFKQYRSAHSTQGFLSNWLSDPRLSQQAIGDLDGSTADGFRPLNSTEAAQGLIGSNAIRLSEEEFRTLSDETDTYFGIVQRMARSTECIATQLDSLSHGFDELTHCLELWPTRLVVDAGDPRRIVKDSETLCQETSPNAQLTWDRDHRPKAPTAVAKGTALVAKETGDLVTRLKRDTLVQWRDSVVYTRSVRDVLTAREELERRYFATVDQLATEAKSQTIASEGNRLLPLAATYIQWRQRSVSKLASDANRLQDRITFTNGQIRAEYERWRRERQEEMLRSLLDMSHCYLNYWSRLSDGWRAVVGELETQRLANNDPVVESHASAESQDHASVVESLEKIVLTHNDAEEGIEDQLQPPPPPHEEEEEKESNSVNSEPICGN